MKILCLDPARNWHGIATGGGLIENLGLGYIAGVARDCSHEVQMIQPPLNDVSDAEILELAIKSDVVAMSCMAYNADDAIRLAQNIRRWSPKTRLVAGGPGPSGMPEWFTSTFDAVIAGEGEHEFRLWLWSEGRIFGQITKAGRNMQWDGRPFPLRDLEVLKKSRMCGAWPISNKEQVVAGIQYGRGCPYSCWFCSSQTVWQRKVCWRDPGSVTDELEEIHERFGVNSVDFMDCTFNANHGKIIALCEEMIQRRINQKICSFVTLNPAQTRDAPEMYVAMVEAGFLKGGFGLEDPTSAARQRLEKHSSDIEACHRTFQAASEAGLMVRCYLIIGAPGQGDTNVEAMKEMLSTWPIDEIRISIFCPFPGTRAWFDLQDQIIERDLRKYDANWPIIRSHWSPEELLAIRKELATHFYQSSNYRTRRDERIARDPRFKAGYAEFESFLNKAGYL